MLHIIDVKEVLAVDIFTVHYLIYFCVLCISSTVVRNFSAEFAFLNKSLTVWPKWNHAAAMCKCHCSFARFQQVVDAGIDLVWVCGTRICTYLFFPHFFSMQPCLT